MYEEQDVEIPAKIAGILLGAVISDTLLFKSPTCTPLDTKIAKKLAAIAGVDIQEFAMDMFKAGTSLVGKTVEEIFNQDYKTFTVNDFNFGVGQINSMNSIELEEIKEKLVPYINEQISN